MKDKYLYFVSYFTKGGKGRATVWMRNKIRNTNDVASVERLIEDVHEKEEVLVSNFILLDTKWGVWEWITNIGEMVMLALCILAIIASFFG